MKFSFRFVLNIFYNLICIAHPVLSVEVVFCKMIIYLNILT